jgi:anti-sigma regulatory factor (Ser/Thr protein kinase)
MGGSEQRLFIARQAELAAAVAFAEAFCELHAVGPGGRMRLRLAVEELFTNTLKHGHRGDSDAPVRIVLEADAQRLGLHYEDSAPRFDPLQYLSDSAPDPATPVTERAPGGYGLPLLAGMAEEFAYEHAAGCNRVRLRFRRED